MASEEELTAKLEESLAVRRFASGEAEKRTPKVEPPFRVKLPGTEETEGLARADREPGAKLPTALEMLEIGGKSLAEFARPVIAFGVGMTEAGEGLATAGAAGLAKVGEEAGLIEKPGGVPVVSSQLATEIKPSFEKAGAAALEVGAAAAGTVTDIPRAVQQTLRGFDPTVQPPVPESEITQRLGTAQEEARKIAGEEGFTEKLERAGEASGIPFLAKAGLVGGLLADLITGDPSDIFSLLGKTNKLTKLATKGMRKAGHTGSITKGDLAFALEDELVRTNKSIADKGEKPSDAAVRLNGQVEKQIEELKNNPDDVLEEALSPEEAAKFTPEEPELKERSFPKTMEEAGFEPGEDLVYRPVKNEEAMIKGRTRVKQSLDKAEQWVRETTESTPEYVATSLGVQHELLTKAQRLQEEASALGLVDSKGAASKLEEAEGLYERANEIAGVAARRLTEAGQFVQAASLASRMSPEGALTRAAKIVNKENEKGGFYFRAKRKPKKLSTDDTKNITDAANNAKDWSELGDEAEGMRDISNKIVDGKAVTPDDYKKVKDTAIKLKKSIDKKVKNKGKPPKKKPKSVESKKLDKLSDEIDIRLGRIEKKKKPKKPVLPEDVQKFHDAIDKLSSRMKDPTNVDINMEDILKEISELSRFSDHVPPEDFKRLKELVVAAGNKLEVTEFQKKATKLDAQIDEMLGRSQKVDVPDKVLTPEQEALDTELKSLTNRLKDPVNINRGSEDVADQLSTLIKNTDFSNPEDVARLRTSITDINEKFEVTMESKLTEKLTQKAEEKLGLREKKAKKAKEIKETNQQKKLSKAVNNLIRKLEDPAELTDDIAPAIAEYIDRIRMLSDDMKIEATLELEQYILGLEDPGILRRVGTAQTISMLLNAVTIGRNITGNELFFRADRLTKYLATPIDWVNSKVTGADRKISFATGGLQGNYWNSFLTGARLTWEGTGIPGRTMDKLEVAPRAVFKGKLNPLTYLEKALGVGLSGFDYAAYNRASQQTLGMLAELDIINNGRKFATKEDKSAFVMNYLANAEGNVKQIADDYGKYITFQDENILSNSFSDIKRAMNLHQPFGAGDVLMKFAKTPITMLQRSLEFSPAGFLKSTKLLMDPLFKNKAPDTREIILSTTRALIGSAGFTGLGYYLFDKGAITAEEGKKDAKARDIKAQFTGEGPFKLNWSWVERWASNGFSDEGVPKKLEGDRLVSYDWAQPLAFSVAMGAEIKRKLKEEKTIGAGVAAVGIGSLAAGAETLIGQPMLQGVQQLFGGGPNRTVTDNAISIATGVPASFVPAYSSQVRKFSDNNKRVTWDPNPLQRSLNKVINKIPFVADQLPIAFSTFGNDMPKEIYADGENTLFNVFFSPAFVTKYKIDPAIQMILEPFEQEERTRQLPRRMPVRVKLSSKKINEWAKTKGIKSNIMDPKDKGITFELTGEDISLGQNFMANNITKRYEKLLSNPQFVREYKSMGADEQEEILAKEVTASWNDMNEWFMNNRMGDYLGEL